MPRDLKALAKERAARLAELEGQITSGLRAYVRVGQALVEIRDDELFREEGYTNFSAYCEGRWGISKSQGYRLLSAAEVAAILSPIGEKAPVNEAQARALAPLKDEPERLIEVWEHLVEEAGDELTAEDVRAAVAVAQAPPDTGEGQGTRRPRKGSMRRSWRLLNSHVDDLATLDVPSNSLSLVVAEPTLDTAESMPVFDLLFELSGRVLVEGGSLALRTSQQFLQVALDTLALYPALDYRWTLAEPRPEPRTEFNPHSRSFWRPIIWATKGRYRGGWVADELSATDPVGHLLGLLTEPTDTVLDPFCKDGELGQQVVAQDRNFIGNCVDGVVLGETRRCMEGTAAKEAAG